MYRINKKFVIKNIDDGILLVDITENKNIFQFNILGKIILENLSLSKEEFIQMITKTYDVTKNKVSKDYDSFIRTLLESNIIEVDNEK